MLCCVCKQKEAVVHYAEIVEGAIQKLDLCEQCAIEKGLAGQITFSMGDMLGGMTDKGGMESLGVVCSNCSMTIDEFRKIGRLGCEKCYDAFSDSLWPMLEQIHRSVKHKGKMPPSETADVDKEEKRVQLEKELKEAITSEDFEKAAYIRDEIKRLK